MTRRRDWVRLSLRMILETGSVSLKDVTSSILKEVEGATCFGRRVELRTPKASFEISTGW
jgi:hypothetical protein